MSRSLGALMLARSGKTDAEIATLCRVSAPAVNYWKAGKKKPSTAKRKILAKHFDILVAAWDQAPPDAASSPAPETTTEVFVVDAKFAELEKLANELLVYVRTAGDATPAEKAKVMNSIANTLRVIDQREQGLEKRILALPKWKRIERTILGALRQHPDALTAVLTALEDLRDETERRDAA